MNEKALTIAIAGLGLIGGSMAKAIKQYTPHHVAAYDLSAQTLEQAKMDGVIDESGLDAFAKADIVLVALCPEAAIEFMRDQADCFRSGALVIDLCGVKQVVCEAAKVIFSEKDVRFIGGHPMAGRECSGYANATPTLFQGASMILTPDEKMPKEVVSFADAFFLSLGFGRIVRTTPKNHDEMIAYTSQMAHIVSNAYVQNPLAERHKGYSGGSFRDLTRVAKLDVNMWTELFLYNAQTLTAQLDTILDVLHAFRDALHDEDAEKLKALLSNGSELKKRISD